MTEEDRPTFFERIVGLSELFHRELSAAAQALYFEALKDLPRADVFAALSDAATEAEFFPKPVEIRRFVIGNPEDAVERAWLAWKHAAVRVGGWSSLVVRDAALADTLVAMWGGWPEVCAADYSPEMWAAKRKEFERVYRVVSQRGLSGSRHLAGDCERHNSQRKEWAEFTPVGLLDGETARALLPEEAEQIKTQIAGNAGARLTQRMLS